MRAERVISESARIDTLGINRTYRNRKTDRICICIRFVLYCDGIACAKEGTLRKCEGRDAVSVLEPLEGVGRPVRPIPRCDARDCRMRVCVRRPGSSHGQGQPGGVLTFFPEEPAAGAAGGKSPPQAKKILRFFLHFGPFFQKFYIFNGMVNRQA